MTKDEAQRLEHLSIVVDKGLEWKSKYEVAEAKSDELEKAFLMVSEGDPDGKTPTLAVVAEVRRALKEANRENQELELRAMKAAVDVELLTACNHSMERSTSALWAILAPEYEGDSSIHEMASQIMNALARAEKDNARLRTALEKQLEAIDEGFFTGPTNDITCSECGSASTTHRDDILHSEECNSGMIRAAIAATPSEALEVEKREAPIKTVTTVSKHTYCLCGGAGCNSCEPQGRG